MRLSISHRTTYSFDAPVDYALQQLRLTPTPGGAQRVLESRKPRLGLRPR